MISTFLGYQLYARDLGRSLANVEAEPASKTAKAYFDANIGKVKSVDDFIGNYRLFSYAMKAYGLEDMTYAKGLMRQVLTSDLSDSSSVANKLSDSRYRAFAQAFDFTTAGAVTPTAIQTASQQTATVALFKQTMGATLSASVVSDATAYYQSHIGSIASVGALERDPKLLGYVEAAYGFDPATPAATITAVLESNLADPKSLLNTTKGAGYAALHGAVTVDGAGAASTQTQAAQSQAAVLATATAYAANAGTTSSDSVKAESTYYAATIATITSVDALLKDPRLVAYVEKAFALPSGTSALLLRQVLTSDPTVPGSLVNKLPDPGYKTMAASFNFAADGSLKTVPFQSADQQQATVTLYTARQSADTAAVDSATQYYQTHIGGIKTVANLEADSQLYKYVLTAYGIDPTTPKATVEHLLEDDSASPTAIVARTPGSHDLMLAAAFTVDADGAAVAPPQAQTADAVTATVSAYMSATKPDSVSQAKAKAETAYYKATIGSIPSVGALLSDKRLVAYVTQAYGLPAGTTTDRLRQVLTSDLSAPGSTANALGGGGAKLAAAFAFKTNGLVASRPAQGAQSSSQTAATVAAYDRQVMEDEAGDQNTGIKLALYFQRMAPTITSTYSILADKALSQVFQTMLGLPAASAKADIDTQAKYLASKVNLADLRDPVKLGKMVQRFAAMYDSANPDTDKSNQIAMLFGTPSS